MTLHRITELQQRYCVNVNAFMSQTRAMVVKAEARPRQKLKRLSRGIGSRPRHSQDWDRQKTALGKAPASRTMSLQQVRAVSCSQGHIIIVVARDIQVKLMNAVDSVLGGWAKLRQLTWAMLLLLGCYRPRLPSLVTWVLYYLSFSKCWSVVLGVSPVIF